MKKLFVTILLTFFMLSTAFGDLIKFDDSKFNLNHMMGVYISPQSMEFFEHNLDQIFEINGISTASYYHHEFKGRTGRKKLKELVKDPKFLKAATKVRRIFRRFFRGIQIRNRHDIEYKVDGIEFSGHWKQFGVQVYPSLENKNSIDVRAIVKADRLKMFVEKIRAKDHVHPWLNEVGVDGFNVELDSQDGDEFLLEVPATVDLLPNGGLKIQVQEIQSNILDVALKGSWRSPMLLPKVKISVNGHEAILDGSRIEASLKHEVPKILSTLQKKVDEFIKTEGTEQLGSLLNESLGKGFSEVISVAPIGAPKPKDDELPPEPVNPYIFGLKLSELNFEGDYFHLGIDGFVDDPQQISKNRDLDPKHIALKKPSQELLSTDDFNVAISLNKGFINRMLQLSTFRGYFNSIELENSPDLRLVGMPYIFTQKNRRGNYEIRLQMTTRYTVTGVSKIFVRNPIQISFSIVLDVVEENGKMKLLIDRIDPNSAFIDSRFIRAFAGKVRSKARDTLRELNGSLRGFVLGDDLPIPEKMAGIPLVYKSYTADEHGNILLYIDLRI